jgi:ADP-heptose:LPS heptosyltransferase
MVAMDSSNMHLASISGIPVISIWGATHPDIGFAPLYQPKSNFVQVSVEELPCRPCSVYGNKPCLRGDKACMERISAHFVAEKVKEILE